MALLPSGCGREQEPPQNCAAEVVASLVPGEAAPEAAASPSARIGTWGVDVAGLSAATAPGDDFFADVNAGWLNANEIPAGFSRFGAFTELALQSEDRVAEIIAEAQAELAAFAPTIGDPDRWHDHSSVEIRADDLGGLAIAYHARRMYVDEHFDSKAPVLDGMTGDQRFFHA